MFGAGRLTPSVATALSRRIAPGNASKYWSVGPALGDKFVKSKMVNGRFVSPFEYKRHSFAALWDEFMWQISDKLGGLKIPDRVRKSYFMNRPPFNRNFQDYGGTVPAKASVTWFGHASCLIQVWGASLTTIDDSNCLISCR